VSDSKVVAEMIKNSRQLVKFSLGVYKNHRFVDMRLHVLGENGDKTIPTKKGIALSPTLWREFKRTLGKVEEAMIQEGWLDREDLEVQE
jgi:hypothetical protein